MTRYTLRISSDEDGFTLIIGSDVDPDRYRFPIEDPEAVYDSVKASIGPWLYERDMAARHATEDESGGYALDDPKSEGYHERMSAIHDNREKV